jgi:type VI secretion system protein ImpH
MGTGRLLGRLEVEDEAFLFYSGHFTHFPRSALALECLLEDYFEISVSVCQLQGQWLILDPADRSLMPSPTHPNGLNSQLGTTLVVGERCWDVQSKFRLRVGPLTYAQFCRLMPNGDMVKAMAQMARAYAGLEFDLDVQPILLAAEVPQTRLNGKGSAASYLGWNSWVRTRPFARDVEDIVFTVKQE